MLSRANEGKGKGEGEGVGLKNMRSIHFLINSKGGVVLWKLGGGGGCGSNSRRRRRAAEAAGCDDGVKRTREKGVPLINGEV